MDMNLVLTIVSGICMLFVGRALGYKQAIDDISDGISITIHIKPDEEEEEHD